MPDGGTLAIQTEAVDLDEHDAASHGVPAGQYVVVSVSDTGTGMSPEALKRAFEPFFTTKPADRGTGLGLSQVYGFVHQSGGHVRIASKPGQGTVVRMFLPAASAEEIVEEEVRPELASEDRRGSSVPTPARSSHRSRPAVSAAPAHSPI
jgi:signal transduction histidine kinase